MLRQLDATELFTTFRLTPSSGQTVATSGPAPLAGASKAPAPNAMLAFVDVNAPLAGKGSRGAIAAPEPAALPG